MLILIELKIVVKNVILLVVPFSWEIILVNSLPLDGMKQVQRCSLTKRENKTCQIICNGEADSMCCMTESFCSGKLHL